MQGEHFRHPDLEGLPVFGRQQRPGYQCERKGQDLGGPPQGRRKVAEREGSSLEGQGEVCSVYGWHRIRHSGKPLPGLGSICLGQLSLAKDILYVSL